MFTIAIALTAGAALLARHMALTVYHHPRLPSQLAWLGEGVASAVLGKE